MFVKYKVIGPKGVCVKREGICFRGMPGYCNGEDIYQTEGKYRIVYTIRSSERTPLDYLFIKHVLRHPLFKELYDARVTFRKKEVDFNIKIMDNYGRTIFYLTLARYLDEGRGVVRAWWKFFNSGVDPLQALVLAEDYTNARRPHVAHRLSRYDRRRSILPFKDWPKFVVERLTTPEQCRWGEHYFGIIESFTSMTTEKFPHLEEQAVVLQTKARLPNYHNYKEIREVVEVLNHPHFESYQPQEQIANEA